VKIYCSVAGVIQVRESLGRNWQHSICHVTTGDKIYREKKKRTTKYTISEKKTRWYYKIKISRKSKEMKV